jgi:hypothetical protein
MKIALVAIVKNEVHFAAGQTMDCSGEAGQFTFNLNSLNP